MSPMEVFHSYESSSGHSADGIKQMFDAWRSMGLTAQQMLDGLVDIAAYYHETLPCPECREDITMEVALLETFIQHSGVTKDELKKLTLKWKYETWDYRGVKKGPTELEKRKERAEGLLRRFADADRAVGRKCHVYDKEWHAQIRIRDDAYNELMVMLLEKFE